MKTTRHYLLAALLSAVIALQLHAQSTAFTYQGQLNENGEPFTGAADFQSTLWDAASGGSQIAASSPAQFATLVTKGLFTLPLDFGGNFPGADRWLQIEVRTAPGGFTPLLPRQQIMSTPYAVTAGNVSGILNSASLSGAYGNALTFGNAGNSYSGSGAGLTALNASHLTSGTVPDSRLSANVARASEVWSLEGNAGTAGGKHFLGTRDNQPLELKVNGMRALRFEDNGDSGSDGGTNPDGAPNVVAGAPVNVVGAGIVGATISGGGAADFNGASYPQTVLSDYATVGGGFGNRVAEGSYFGTIAGGYRNDLGLNSYYGVVGGGNNNNISDNAAYATIAGGYINDVGSSSGYSAIGGGRNNNIANSSGSAAIAGGYNNDIEANSAYSAIGGGYDNNVADNSQYATVAGGHRNNVGPSSFWSVIGGGSENKVVGQTQHATIAGGYSNQVGVLSHYGSIGGGRYNHIADGSWYATIGGGFSNAIGSNSHSATIGGGTNNTVAENASHATIPGGYSNHATNEAFAAGSRANARHTGSFVWGGDSQRATSSAAAHSVTFRASGGYRLYSTIWDVGVMLEPGSGSWTSMSDRNAKEEIEPVDPLEILDKVTSLPVATWKYKSQDHSVRHIGPMAQDFKAAFAVGESDTGITTVDADGVALAAIQGLNQKLEQKTACIAELEARLAALEQMMQQLAHNPVESQTR